jgi:hypothetical protein
MGAAYSLFPVLSLDFGVQKRAGRQEQSELAGPENVVDAAKHVRCLSQLLLIFGEPRRCDHRYERAVQVQAPESNSYQCLAEDRNVQ